MSKNSVKGRFTQTLRLGLPTCISLPSPYSRIGRRQCYLGCQRLMMSIGDIMMIMTILWYWLMLFMILTILWWWYMMSMMVVTIFWKRRKVWQNQDELLSSVFCPVTIIQIMVIFKIIVCSKSKLIIFFFSQYSLDNEQQRQQLEERAARVQVNLPSLKPTFLNACSHHEERLLVSPYHPL